MNGTVIDLNCDMGELPGLLEDGTQDQLMRFVSSVNIACGAHAGDEELIRTTIRSGLQHKVAIGAHPGYPDRLNFGRVRMPLTGEQISATVTDQLRTFSAISEQCGADIFHVKPHGALYNAAATDDTIATAIAEGVARWRTDVLLVGLAGSGMLSTFARAGFATASEAFADRRYESDGTLRSRTLPGALLADPMLAARQSVSIARDGYAETIDGTRIQVGATTICIHSDTPDSVAVAAEVVKQLQLSGIAIRARG